MKIIADTREQDNHISRELIKEGYEVIREKLDFGDYSFVDGDTDYRTKFVIERKKTLDEIITNINSKDCSRFYREFHRIRKEKAKCIIIIEQTKEDLDNKKYRARITPYEVQKMLKTFCKKYNVSCFLMKRENATYFIINTIKNICNKQSKNI